MKKQHRCPHCEKCPYSLGTGIHDELRLRSVLYLNNVLPSDSHSIGQQTCLAPECNAKFNTCCPTQLFCSVECYQRSGWMEKWEHFLTLYANDLGKLKRRLAKERYRQTEKGQDSRRREYAKRERSEDSGHTGLKKRGEKRFCCLRPACCNTFILTRQTKNRCYCSRECRNVMHDKRRELLAVWKNNHCRVAYLVWAFLKLMKPVCISEE